MNPETTTERPVLFQVSTRHGLEYRKTLIAAEEAAKGMISKAAPLAAIVAPNGDRTGFLLDGRLKKALATVNVASFGLPFTKPFAVVSRSGFVITEHDTEAEALVEAQTRCSASDTRTAVFAAGNSNKVRHFDWDGCSYQPREVSLEELARQEREAG